MSHRRVIYTAVFGNKTYMPQFEVIPNDWDFVYFTDNNELHSDLWKIIYTKGSNSDPRRSSRYLKLQPHIIFPDHEMSVWMDGSLRLTCNINNLLDVMNVYDFAGLYHPHEVDGLFHEGERCIKYGKDDPMTIKDQLKSTEAKFHFPKHKSEFKL